MEEKSVEVDILLATYNGAEFLREQLDSVFDQSFLDFRILVRDDGSSDRTLEILRAYQQQYPGKLILLQEDKKNVGATQNFGILLQQATAPYIAFCDQDDKWFPEKLEISIRELKKLESENPDKPCMVYSDMQLIDDKGHLLNTSVWQQLKLNPVYFTFPRLLVQNIPHGCAMTINRAMQQFVSPIPKEAMLHDHWIALLTAAFGAHHTIKQPLLQLRNHSSNVTRKASTFSEKISRFTSNFWSDTAYEQMVKSRVAQAKAIRERYATKLSSEQQHLLDEFISLGSTKGLQRKWIYLKNGFFRTTWQHTLKMILRG